MINKKYISIFLIFISSLYFLLLIVAKQSFLFNFLNFIPNYFFGQIVTYILYIFIFIIGALDFKYKLINLRNILKFFILFSFLSAIFSFGILEDENFKGGQIGEIILFVLNSLLGNKIQATKVLTVFLFIFLIIVFYYRLFLLSFKVFKIEIYEDVKKQKIKVETKQIENKQIDNKQNKENIKIKVKSDFKIESKQQNINLPEDKPSFDINLLNISNLDFHIDEKYLIEKARSVKEKLEEFNIPVEIEGFNVGPSVIQIKIKPLAGIAVSKIESRKKDLQLMLKVSFLRIIAPLPGTDSIGIEIPNPNPKTIYLGSLLNHCIKDGDFTNLVLGISIDGQIIVKSLSGMPHLLVAGTTGSGKSVAINSFILSLIYQNSPNELKFIMIDPKQVELGIYEDIPYLLAPILTLPQQAVKVLKWLVGHMEERYNLLLQKKCRNIFEYNEKGEKLPFIVVIIDELADLMMASSKKEVELYITRLAQKARAVGIHLILATQRPSVNVITGILKANIPTRVAFSVISQVDSRVIIDTKGAEDLIGKGDMLFIDQTTKYPIRIQAPYVSTKEVEKVVNYLREKYGKYGTLYNEEIIKLLNENNEIDFALDDDDELIQKAIEIIKEERKASATLLQRRLGIGFPRAARIIDILEKKGIIGPQQGSKPRDIYI